MATARIARVARPSSGQEQQQVTKRLTMRPTVRVARASKQQDDSALDAAKTKAEELLKSIAKFDAQIDTVVEGRTKAVEQLEAVLREAKLTGYTDGKYEAEIVDVISRVSRDISVPTLRKEISCDADFYDCLSVSMTNVKKYLSEKEIDKIATKSGGVKTGSVMKLSQIKNVTKKKKV